MTIFIFDDEAREQLRGITEFAEANRYDIDFMSERVRQMERGTIRPYPDEHTAQLSTGFWVTMTIEEHPGGWMRHCSISSPDHEKIPLPPVAQLVMKELGFVQKLEDCHIWPEECESVNRFAINILEPMPATSKLAVN